MNKNVFAEGIDNLSNKVNLDFRPRQIWVAREILYLIQFNSKYYL